MDPITRNNIFMEHMNLINRTMHRNRLLLYALHLDPDDVYQELAIAALQAIDSFDARRCDSVKVHIWAKLQYTILDIKRQYRPHGLTPQGGNSRPSAWPLDLLGEDRVPPAMDDQEEQMQENRLRQALSHLEPQEQHAVILYLKGARLVHKAEKHSFDSALDKLREFYLAAQYSAQFVR